MSIKVKIHFTADLSDVVIEDVLSGYKTEPDDFTNGQDRSLEPDDSGGEATVRISGKQSKKPVQGGRTLRNGETYNFP
jgi:hypothetical protein